MRPSGSGLLVILAAIVCVMAPPLHARADEVGWTTRSLYGYSVQDLAVDPNTPAYLYAGTDRGLLHSPDGGGRWSALAGPFGSVTTVVVDLHDPAVIYALADGQLWKTADRGDTWDALGAGTIVGPRFLVVDPHKPGRLYVGTDGGGLWSADGGRGWRDLALPVKGQVTAISPDPNDAEVMHVAVAGQGLFKSTDGGKSWILSSPSGEQFSDIVSIAIDCADSQILYSLATTPDYGRLGPLLRSRDGGAAWVPKPSTGGYGLSLMTTDPHHGGHVYVVEADRRQHAPLFHSRQGGDEWTNIGAGFHEYATISRLIFDPKVEGVMYAIADGQLYKSQDGGVSWSPRQRTGDHTFVSAHPTEADRLYTGFPQGGVFASGDGGGTWAPSSDGLPQQATAISLAFDPQDPDTLYLSANQGLYRSNDGGTTWRPTGLPPNVRANVVAVHPRDGQRLLVGGPDGLLATSDGGTSWAALSVPGGGAITALAIHPDRPEILYAGTQIGLYHSNDGGETWQPYDGAVAQAIADVIIPPSAPSVVLAALTDGRVWSESGLLGAHQEDLGLPEGAQITDLVVDPFRAGVLYAGTTAGVYASRDEGRTWQPINDGLGGTNVVQLAATRADPPSLLALAGSPWGQSNSLWQYSLQQPAAPQVVKPASGETPGVTGTVTPQPPSPAPEGPLSALSEVVSQVRDSLGSLPLIPILVVLLLVGVAGLLAVLLAGIRRRRKPVRCPKCHTINDPSNRFCLKCGRPLSETADRENR